MTVPSPSLLDKPSWARRSICESVSQAFDLGDRIALNRGPAESVWSRVEVFIGGKATIDVQRGIFEIAWRSPVLRLSIAIRLGEVRVGVIIPRYSAMNVDLLGEDDSYPRGGRGCERMVRALGDRYVLFDYVFSGVRIGEDDLTHRALAGDISAMEVLADGIYYEARHLREGVIHHVYESGMLLQEAQESKDTGVVVLDVNDLPMEVESQLDQLTLAKLVGLPESSVLEIGKSRGGLNRFILLIPEEKQAAVFAALAEEPMALAA